MALKSYACNACLGEFMALTGAQIASGDSVVCKCGSVDVRELVSGGARLSKGFDYDAASPEEKQMAMGNRRKLEASAEQILSGEMEYRHPKGLPDAYAPRVPSHLSKRYY